MKARFLVEVRILDSWMPYKILTRSPDIRHALSRLPDLVADIEGGEENARIKTLVQDVQIANAKIEITKIWGIENVET
jgi:hypothetical protein